jgi:uncharacterized membrane protein
MTSLLAIIRPEFFDIFGVFVFIFLIALSLWGIKTRKALPRWALIILFLIGISGLIIDGAIVYITYLV